MNDLQRLLAQDVRHASDNLEDVMSEDPGNMFDIANQIPRLVGAIWDIKMAQWAASLDIKTKHDLMKSSIDGIR